MNPSLLSFSVLASLAAIGCGGAIREGTAYRDDTATMIQSQANPKIQSCFQGLVLATPNPSSLAGSATVHFTVAKETGVVTAPTIVSGTTTQDAVNQCVLSGLSGARLTPPDNVDGDATFAWQFAVQPRTP